jgi:hypothetical protein
MVVSASASSTVGRCIFIENNQAITGLNKVSNNKIEGNGKATEVLVVYRTTYNIGTLIVRGNMVSGVLGKLIRAISGSPIVTNDLIVDSNFIKSTSASPKIILVAETPTANYTATANIER